MSKYRPWYRPSGLGRLAECPGSGQLEDTLRYQGVELRDATAESDEGTMLHKAMAWFLTGIGERPKLTQEQQDAVDSCLEFLLKLGIDQDSDVSCEVTLRDDVTGLSGTLDTIAGWTGDRLVIVDWKFGRGDLAEEHISAQLSAYTHLVHRFYFGVGLEAHIHQPRLDRHYEVETPDSEDGWKELEETFIAVRDAAHAPGAPLNPSPTACRYCPCLPHCPAAQGQAMEVARSTERLPTHGAEVDRYWERILAAEKAIESKKEEMRQMLLSGAIEGEEYYPQKRSGKRRLDDNQKAFARLGGTLSAEEIAGACTVAIGTLIDIYRRKKQKTKEVAEKEFYALLGDAITKGDDYFAIAKRRRKDPDDGTSR